MQSAQGREDLGSRRNLQERVYWRSRLALGPPRDDGHPPVFKRDLVFGFQVRSRMDDHAKVVSRRVADAVAEGHSATVRLTSSPRKMSAKDVSQRG